jgi:hypothetical protein
MKNTLFLLALIFSTFLFAQESVTKNYLDADNLVSAKNFSKVYHERILSKKYTVRNIGNPQL